MDLHLQSYQTLNDVKMQNSYSAYPLQVFCENRRKLDKQKKQEYLFLGVLKPLGPICETKKNERAIQTEGPRRERERGETWILQMLCNPSGS